MTDPRTFYARMEAAAGQVLQALADPGGAGRAPRRAAFRSRRIQDRLQRQREVLRRLQEGEVRPEEALVLLLEEQAPAAPAPEYGSYLSRLGGDLRELGPLPVLPGQDRLRSPREAPEAEPPEGGLDD